mmetsp:Transcript_36733/g.84548  ORF Transcript_36733/g.84548 Transcript_36733/m.84548 type:complete len:848 (-) Transcript_36733:42-2585(-)
MPWYESAADWASVALDFGQVAADHWRSNHLHKEAIAQALRVHEQEVRSANAYHRVEVQQNNRIHARELLQNQLQHVEQMDLEKCVAFRQNVRDEWEQITGKAETVLIVNTLMLGVGFTMLVEGRLPDSTPIELPAVPTLYSALLATSLCELLMSVRLAMILRFRVGRMVVMELRRAILRARSLEHAFRGSPAYIRSNIPASTTPACDDRQVLQHVQPITATEIAVDDPEAVPGFVSKDGPHERTSATADRSTSAGYSFRASLGCPRRMPQFAADEEELPEVPFQPSGRSIPSSASRTTTVKHPQYRRQGTMASSMTKWSTVSEHSVLSPSTTMAVPASQVTTQVPHDVSTGDESHEVVDWERNDDLPSGTWSMNACSMGLQDAQENPAYADFTSLRGLAEAHAQMLLAREQEDSDLADRLEDLRQEYCKPYDLASQASFYTGTLLLLISACVYAWAANHKSSTAQGGYASQPYAGYVFAMNATMTLLGLAYMEAKNRLARSRTRHELSSDIWISDAVQPQAMMMIVSLALIVNGVFWVSLSQEPVVQDVAMDTVVQMEDAWHAPPSHVHRIEWPPFFQPTHASYNPRLDALVASDPYGSTYALRRVEPLDGVFTWLVEDFALPEQDGTDPWLALQKSCWMGTIHAPISTNASSISRHASKKNLAQLELQGVTASVQTQMGSAHSLHELAMSSSLSCLGHADATESSKADVMLWFATGRQLVGGKFQADPVHHSLLFSGIQNLRVPSLEDYCPYTCTVVDMEMVSESSTLLILLKSNANGASAEPAPFPSRLVLMGMSLVNGRRTLLSHAPAGLWVSIASRKQSLLLLGDDGELAEVDIAALHAAPQP